MNNSPFPYDPLYRWIWLGFTALLVLWAAMSDPPRPDRWGLAMFFGALAAVGFIHVPIEAINRWRFNRAWRRARRDRGA